MGESPVQRQFAPVADRYVHSPFHADPVRLAEVVELVQPRPEDEVLDVATGTGHAALALAPHVASVVGLDLTPAMLERAAAAAEAAGAKNVTWVQGDAQQLPFGDASFDVYVARAAPHHFPDLERALSEAFRVLRPGGRAALIDCSPPPAARDVLHRIELARDPTHVLSRTVGEWVALLERAGFAVERADRRELPWDYADWMGRMDVAAAEQERIAREIEDAEPEARAALAPERRDKALWHRYWHALIRARRPA
jgi:ubiquinone/menaquinone biosynthesis C-methylase UbiE